MPADYSISITLKKAINDLTGRDPYVLANNTGSEFVAQGSYINIRFIAQNYFVEYPSFEVKHESGPETNPITKILLLHYLGHATKTPLLDKWISFKELPGGYIYNGPFINRAIKPFVKIFGKRPDEFRFAAEKLGGTLGQGGDMSMIIPVLPKVLLNYILWLGNEEFPASATILFDSSAASYLPTEDYVVLCGLLLKELNKIAAK
jgi:hypothetical protein